MHKADETLTIGRSFFIQINHVASGKTVYFKGFVQRFEDQFSAKWNPENVYGRPDPIVTYQGTERRIALEWDILASDLPEAQRNLAKIEVLMAMLYPVYAGDQHSTLQAAPLLKVKFANFATRPSPGNAGAMESARNQMFSGATTYGQESGVTAGGESIARATVGAGKEGLLAAVDGFTYAPDFELGFFLGNGVIYPKLVKMSCNFTVLHQDPMGWKPTKTSQMSAGFGGMASQMFEKENAKWRGSPRFPYGVGGLSQEVPGNPKATSDTTPIGIRTAMIASITGMSDEDLADKQLDKWSTDLDHPF